MGSHQSSTEQFNQSNWKEISSPFSEIIQYENNFDHNIHIQRHPIRTTSEPQFDKIKQISFLRKHNPRWVAAVYFQEEEAEDKEFCVSKYEASLFLQKIPIRLCDLRHIPFPDVLHLYDQALNGFYQLARVIGCFPVETDYIGINERGVVKVWAGSKWSQITVKSGAITQESMVRSIVECLEQSIDKYSMPQKNPSIRNFLYRTADRINFEEAIAELKNFSKTTSSYGIPTRLHSIQENPGRYDTQRNAQRQLVTALGPQNYFNSRSSYQVPPHYSPRFSPQRQTVHEQITTFRKVDSFSNEPIHRQPPISNFAAQRETRAVSAYTSNEAILRQGSNPQLIKGINPVRANSSFKQLDQYNSIIQSSHLVSIGSYISPQASQQMINHIQPPIYSGNSNRLQPPVSVPYPVFQQNKMINQQNSQKVRFPFVDCPPSQEDVPMQPVFHQQVTVERPPTPKIRHLQSFSQENGRPLSRKNNIQGQSLIMQLYTSQDNTTLTPNTPLGETKHFGNIKRSQSYHIDLQKFDSATVINDSKSGSMRGIPHTEVKYLAPSLTNKNQFSNLNSIEEVQTEYNWRQNGSKNNSIYQEYANHEAQQLNNLNQQYKPIIFKNSHKIVDENDGKSSEDFLRKLKQISYQSVPNSNFQIIPESNLNRSYIQKKKPVGFADTRNVIDIYSSRKKESSYKPGECNFGRSAQSKQENYINDYYDSRMFPNISEGHPGIDPDIWADIQRYQQ